MGFASVKQLVDAQTQGRVSSCSFRKLPTQASSGRVWVDLSMAGGNPLPNYYASSPLVAATLDGFRGIFHGDAKAPYTKHLTELMLITPTAGLVGRYMLLDYLLYYPFVDLDDLDTQVMDNALTLPRYADGAGVMLMLVAVTPTVGGGSVLIDYVNQDGVARQTQAWLYGTAAYSIANLIPVGGLGTIGNPFVNLASGDTGVRRVLSITNLAAHGGLCAAVLVKPLADAAVREINTPAEQTYVSMIPGAPRIQDGAYLGLIMNCAATVAAGTLAGRANFAWG